MKNVHEKSIASPPNGTIESLNLKIDGHQAHYLKTGNGPPIVLIHGGASDSHDWVETMTFLHNSYSLYALDLIGYGLSERDESGYYLSDFVEFTLGFLRALNLDSSILVGHSLGGRVCLEIALRYPEKVRRLVLIDTVGFSNLAKWGKFLGAAAWGLRRVMKRPQPYPRLLVDDNWDKDWICLERLPQLRVPTLLIWNRRDPYYSVKGALKAKRLKPEIRLEIFPYYGHAPHLKNRDVFNNLLLGFLNHDSQ